MYATLADYASELVCWSDGDEAIVISLTKEKVICVRYSNELWVVQDAAFWEYSMLQANDCKSGTSEKHGVSQTASFYTTKNIY